MEARHLASEVVVCLAEAAQVQVAQQVHELCEKEHSEECPVHVKSEVGASLLFKELVKEGCLCIQGVEKVEGNEDSEEEPKIADLIHDHIDRLAWLAVEMNEHALDDSLCEMNDRHPKREVLAQAWLEWCAQFVSDNLVLLVQTERVDFLAVVPEEAKGKDGAHVDEDL